MLNGGSVRLQDCKGVGEKRLKLLNEMGIYSLRDVLNHFPKSYINSLDIRNIADILDQDMVCIEGILDGNISNSYFGKLSRSYGKISDKSGSIKIAWFNMPWLSKQYKSGDKLCLYGRAYSYKKGRYIVSPRLIKEKGIVAEYKLIKGISDSLFKSLVKIALEEKIDDELSSLASEEGLLELSRAIREIHFPTSSENLKNAKKRLSFDSLFYYQLLVKSLAGERKNGLKLGLSKEDMLSFTSSLPFKLTNAQLRASSEILEDLGSGKKMNRLLQGDVGSGKTVIAFLLGYVCFKNKVQCAIMAPTEILSEQHYQNFKRLFPSIPCALLNGSMSPKTKKEALEQIEEGSVSVIFGTHALISSNVKYSSLAVAVTDEQHRFGVRQRKMLEDKSNNNPHVLVMSATPIPRTLSLILYGDLDISVIDSLPPNRQKISTHIVSEQKTEAMYGFIRDKINEGEQAYIICPTIEDEEDSTSSATGLYKRLKNSFFKGIELGLLHGNQKAEEKERSLEDFRLQKTKLLVSTTVVEVGVDIKNATIIAIVAANRFGLSQLHQLRGRVGRSDKKSYCFLIGDRSPRLEALEQSSDGFFIANKDLEIRGPGEVLGSMQAGRGLIIDDIDTLFKTKALAERLISTKHEGLASLLKTAEALYEKRLASTTLN